MPYKNPEDQKRAARAHYLANKDAYKARALAHNRRQRERARRLVAEAKSVPCSDCGVAYPPYVMQFDHLGEQPKLFAIGTWQRVSNNLIKLEAEIAKCDVVCANCHAERTHQRRTSGGSRI